MARARVFVGVEVARDSFASGGLELEQFDAYG